LTNVGATLGKLDLSDNQIRQIEPADFEGLWSLRYLNIAGNHLQIFPIFGDATATLRSVYLSNNEIGDIPSVLFAQMTKLNVLSLANNNLTSCPDFPQLPRPGLSILKLDRNPLINLPIGLFNGLPNLKDLYLSYLLAGPYLLPIFNPMSTKLEKLIFDHTPLQNISSAFLNTLATSTHLRKMYLRRTNLIGLPNPALAFPDKLLHFDLTNNLLDCDCYLAWMVK
jgi:Leucine-rich repeat (LRR) protein